MTTPGFSAAITDARSPTPELDRILANRVTDELRRLAATGDYDTEPGIISPEDAQTMLRDAKAYATAAINNDVMTLADEGYPRPKQKRESRRRRDT